MGPDNHDGKMGDRTAAEVCELYLEPMDEQLLVVRPFEDEEEYWSLQAVRMETLHCFHQLEEGLATWLTLPLTHHQDIDVDGFKAVRDLLQKRSDDLLAAYRARRELTPADGSAPRVLRLARSLALSDMEVDILHCLVLQICDPSFGKKRSTYDEVGDIATFLGLDAESFFDIFDPDSGERLFGVEMDHPGDASGWIFSIEPGGILAWSADAESCQSIYRLELVEHQ